MLLWFGLGSEEPEKERLLDRPFPETPLSRNGAACLPVSPAAWQSPPGIARHGQLEGASGSTDRLDAGNSARRNMFAE